MGNPTAFSITISMRGGKRIFTADLRQNSRVFFCLLAGVSKGGKKFQLRLSLIISHVTFFYEI